jgi:hypothetical protein
VKTTISTHPMVLLAHLELLLQMKRLEDRAELYWELELGSESTGADHPKVHIIINGAGRIGGESCGEIG